MIKLAPDLGYDDFHHCVFKQAKASVVKEQIRKFLKEGWDNHNRLDISGTIEMLVDQYLKSKQTNCYSVLDINNGLCNDFAESLIEKLGGEDENLRSLDTSEFYSAFSDEALWDETIPTDHGGVWNKEALDKYGYPPMVERAHVGIHQWIWFNGKHYDAEAPEGVDSPWDLPIFRRELKKTLIRENWDHKGYLLWKRRNVTIRGIKELGKENGGMGMLGSGLYTAALGNKTLARQYGKVYFVVGAIPKNPKVFNTLNDWQTWEYNVLIKETCKRHGIENGRVGDFNEITSISEAMLEMGYDGVIIKGREMVYYTPD
jgi:hypothetical protein